MTTDIPYVPKTLLVTVAGCPNACRHCLLRGGQRKERNEEYIRNVHDRFAAYAQSHGQPVPELYLYMQEPFFHNRWQAMYELADTLNRSNGHPDAKQQMAFDVVPTVGWRMVHTDGFADWFGARYKGVQLTFFGLPDTHDWFAGRKGAFDDLLGAARRAFDMNLTVHMSVMLHSRMLHDFPELLSVLAQHGLPLFKGWSWESYQTLDPVGRAYAMEDLRPQMDEIEALPTVVKARIRMRRSPEEWEQTESSLVKKVLDSPNVVSGYNSGLGLLVAMDGSVYPDHCWMEDTWHCLGNILHDEVALITERFRTGDAPGLHARATVPIAELARRFGHSEGRKAYAGLRQIIERWIRQWCEAERPKV